MLSSDGDTTWLRSALDTIAPGQKALHPPVFFSLLSWFSVEEVTSSGDEVAGGLPAWPE